MPKTKPNKGQSKPGFKHGKLSKKKSSGGVKSGDGSSGKKTKNAPARERKPYVGKSQEKPGPFKKVLMANPKRSFGRNKRHGNADLSDADSLPSESDNDADSDLDLPTQKKGNKKTVTKTAADDSDSDIDQFLAEDEGEETKVEESSDEEDGVEESNQPIDESSTVRVTTKMVSEWRAAIQVGRFNKFIVI